MFFLRELSHFTAVALDRGVTVGTDQCFHDTSIHRGGGVTCGERVWPYCSKLCARILEVAMDKGVQEFSALPRVMIEQISAAIWPQQLSLLFFGEGWKTALLEPVVGKL